MPDQTNLNAMWRQTFNSNIGIITMLVAPKRASTLRKPYQYSMPAKQCRQLTQTINTVLKAFSGLQHAGMDAKRTKYGCRLNIFALGYRPGYTGDQSGIDANQWASCTQQVLDALKQTLGDDVALYVEPWSATNKFQARFETYVLFPELA